MMENVLFNYVVNGVVIEGPMPYASVLQRTGLKDTVGFTELGYIEYMPTEEAHVFTKEQISNGIRSQRRYLLQQSDWTQLSDTPISESVKSAWSVYRQALRDLPKIHLETVDPLKVTWPMSPDNT